MIVRNTQLAKNNQELLKEEGFIERIQEIIKRKVEEMEIDYCRDIFVLTERCFICKDLMVCVFDIWSKVGLNANFAHICLNIDCRHFNYFGFKAKLSSRISSKKKITCPLCKREVVLSLF